MFITPITISAPHIYISALAFSPRCSACSIFPSCQWHASYPGIPLVQGRLTKGPNQLLRGHCVTLNGHSEPVNSIAFSPDGARIVSGSSDKTIRFWDAKTGAADGEPLVGHPDRVNFVSFLPPNGARIISHSDDGVTRFWDAQTGAARGQSVADGANTKTTPISGSPDGGRMASVYEDCAICIRDRAGVMIGKSLVRHTDSVLAIEFSPDGRLVASGSRDTTVRLWDAWTCAAIAKPLHGHSGAVNSVAFSPDGALIASGSDDHTIRPWRTAEVRGGHSRFCIASNASLPATSSTIGRLRPGSLLRLQLQRYSPRRSSFGAVIIKDGWIMGRKGELLLWVPPEHRRRIDNEDDDHHGHLTLDPSLDIDFQYFKCGEQWMHCRDPVVQSSLISMLTMLSIDILWPSS